VRWSRHSLDDAAAAPNPLVGGRPLTPVGTMPVMKLDGGGHYFMINMSDAGEEMVESPGKDYSVQLSTLIEEKIADDDASDPVTDVFLVSHGYKTDKQGAVQSYANWMNGYV